MLWWPPVASSLDDCPDDETPVAFVDGLRRRRTPRR